MREHVMLNRLLKREPDQTLPRVTTQASGMLAMGIHWATDVLMPPSAGASARADLTARVEIIARFVHSTMLTRHGVVDLDNVGMATVRSVRRRRDKPRVADNR